MIRKMEGTRNVQGCNVAKSKTQKMCRSQGINGQLVELEQSHGSSLEPLDKHFQSHGFFMKPGKYPNWKIKSATISTHDVPWMDLCDPTTHADCEKKSQIAPAALGLSRVGPSIKIAGSGLVTNGCHISWG